MANNSKMSACILLVKTIFSVIGFCTWFIIREIVHNIPNDAMKGERNLMRIMIPWPVSLSCFALTAL